MERLTIDEIIAHCERETNREDDFLGTKFFEERPMNTTHMKRYWEHRQVAEWLKQLKSYKEAEEQGLLLRLTCAIGSTVYALTPFCEICEKYLDKEYACEFCCQGNFVTETKFDYEMIPMFGKTVFLTKEEAEMALKQMGE